MQKEKTMSVVDSICKMIETPVSGNVMPILVCFLVMVGCLCGILYMQMTQLQTALEKVSFELREVGKSLKVIETVMKGG